MTDLSNIIERVKQATGPDRDLDAAIANAVLPLPSNYYHWQSSRPKGTPNKPQIGYWIKYAPAYTASLDAIVGLIEREFPGWDWNAHFVMGLYCGALGPANVNDWAAEVRCATMPIALCAAFLLALSAKETP